MNRGFVYREQVGPRQAGRSVLDHLASRHRHSSAETWQRRIEAGEVRLDGRLAGASDSLSPGQWLEWSRPPWEEPAVPLSFAVLHRDDHLLAVAKPRGLPTVPAGGFLTHTLLHRIRSRWPEADPLHRLGRGTSGLVLFARTPQARRRLAADWREGRVEKAYLALVEGTPDLDRFTVTVPIGLVPHPRLGRVHAANPSGRPSTTRVRVLARHEGRAVVEATIPTGRPHQIRIHLAAAGHPLVGDLLYVAGGGVAPEPALPGEGGYWLHAHRLIFEHPASGRRVDMDCPAPPALQPPPGVRPVLP